MSGKSIKFGGEKVSKSSSCKNKKSFRAEDININKILVSKEETYVKNHLDTLFDVIMVMLLDHYA